MNNNQASKNIVNQINDQWAKFANGYVIGNKYPAIVEHNGMKRKLVMYKIKSGGVLYVEAMDTNAHGTFFTVYKVRNDGLYQVGIRNMFAHTEAARDHNIAEFNAVFAA